MAASQIRTIHENTRRENVRAVSCDFVDRSYPSRKNTKPWFSLTQCIISQCNAQYRRRRSLAAFRWLARRFLAQPFLRLGSDTNESKRAVFNGLTSDC